MSDDWPSDWDDPAEDELFSAADEAELAEVSAFLASVATPALPDTVGARITAALAAEAAARTSPQADTLATLPESAADKTGSETATGASVGAATPVDGARTLEPRGPFWPRRRSGAGGRRGYRIPHNAVAAVATCLAIAGAGYGLSTISTASSSSSFAGAAGSAASSGPVFGGFASSAAGSSAGPGTGTSRPSAAGPASAGASAPQASASAAGSAAPSPAPTASFSVVASGTAYDSTNGHTLMLQMDATAGSTSLARTAPTAAEQACATEAVSSDLPNLASASATYFPMLFDASATYGGQAVYVVFIGIANNPSPIVGAVVPVGDCSDILVSVSYAN